jgi:Ca2+/H+ antiporter, TMEM165/GDT1 family
VNSALTLSFGSVVLVAFWSVLVAELVGDKSIYNVASLSLRFRPRIVFASITAAFAAKALAAVSLAQLLVHLQSKWTDLLSAAAFFFSALFIWFKEPDPPRVDHPSTSRWWQAAVICFASLFFTEWGDPGQIALAALSMKFHAPLATWVGGTLAMATKGGLAITLGLKLRDRLPLRALRAIASASCCILGTMALTGIFFR